MSADYWHDVTLYRPVPYGQQEPANPEQWRAGFHRVEGGALILTNATEQTRYAGEGRTADYLIVPLHTFNAATVTLVERES